MADPITDIDPMTEIDPISLEIYWNRLIAIMDETDRALVRTSLSTVIGEARDFAVMLMDADGYGIAQSVLSLTMFTIMIPRTLRELLKRFPPETLQEGDVLLTNDPWLGSGHLPDFNIFRPVFHKGRPVAYIGCAAHVSDIGGTVTYFGARDVFEEGLRLPPCKIYKAGQPNEEIFEIIRANVRVPDMVVGDLRAIMAAEHVGMTQLLQFLEDYHLDGIEAISRSIQARSERAMRRAISAIPAKTYRHSVVIDGYKDPMTIAAAVTVAGDKMVVDFAGSSAETRNGAINCTYNATIGDTLTALKCALLPELPNNEALCRPIEVLAPEGSVLNCRFPAPVKARSVTCLHTHEAVYGALVEAIPDQVQAGSGIALVIIVNGQHPDGRPFNAFVVVHGGTGATMRKDGLSATCFPINATVTPTEVLENVVPILVMRKELKPDSAGEGRFRGGVGQCLVVQTQGSTPLTLTLRPNNRIFPPPGLMGGGAGSLCRILLNGEVTSETVIVLQQGDILECQLAGGGGFGSPGERRAELKQWDKELGYTT